MLKLYDDYYRLVRKIISKIVQKSEDLDDLVQDAFIRLIEKIPLLRTLDHCRKTAYIAYTSKSIAINYIKHRDVVNSHAFYGMEDDVSETISNEQDDLEDQIIHQLDVENLCNSLLRLPESQKDILVFKYFLEMKDPEIAEVLGISPKSVPQYVKRARLAAKKHFRKEA